LNGIQLVALESFEIEISNRLSMIVPRQNLLIVNSLGQGWILSTGIRSRTSFSEGKE
jgi:hypothetical protein